MNPWMLASLGFIGCLAPCAVTCARGEPLDRLAGLETASIVLTLLLVTLATAMNRPSFYDLAVALALTSFGGGLVFARFLERWL